MPAASDRIEEDEGLRDFVAAERRRMTVNRLLAAIEACDGNDAAQAMCWVLDNVRARLPAPMDPWGNAREEAEYWADIATPVELEAYAAASLRKIERTSFCEGARKRIFAAIWESFDDSDRRSFLARVDPHGKFRGRT